MPVPHEQRVPKNLGLLLRETAERFPNKTAFRFKLSDRYVGWTWGEALAHAEAVASFFLAQGVAPGERVAILSENRPEWAVVDLACQSIGAASVPIFTSLTSSEIEYLLKDSGASWLAVSQKELFEKAAPACRNVPSLKGLVAFDGTLALLKNAVGLPVAVMAEILKTPKDPRLDGLVEQVPPQALASLIYTSGTTGAPKGVMLSHANFIENCVRCRSALKMGRTDRHLSFLPLSHVFERACGHYLMILIGAEIAYAQDMDSVPKNILEIRPTFLLGVPRFYEKIRARVLEKVAAASSVQKGLFHWAWDLGRKHRLGKSGFFDALQRRLACALVCRKFRAGLGGRLRFCVSGGAPLARELAEFFYDFSVLILEGYGLTEAPVICCNREERFRFGSIGLALDEIEVRLAPDGEIQTKSPCVMSGYWNKPEETAAALKNGWFSTGDLGRIDADGFLFITGRKKELIVTSGGKKVCPRPIEELLEKDPAVLRCVLYGEGKKYLTALVVPRQGELVDFARASKIAFDDYAGLLKNRLVIDWLDARIQKAMKDYASFEKIKAFALLEHDFTQSAGELTPTLKVKRDVVLSRHTARLEALYPPEP